MEPIDITKQFKREERKRWWKEKREQAAEWVDEHKTLVALAIPAVAKGVYEGVKIFGRVHTRKLDERNKDLRWYDNRLGVYWDLKRKPKSEERLRIEKRVKIKGELLGEVLEEYGLLR